MNTKKNTIKNIFCSIIAFLMFALANVGIMSISKKQFEVFAADESNEVSISNSNFTSDKKTSYPIKSPSGYDSYSDNKETSNPSSKSGVINLAHDDYSSKFSIAKEGRTGLDDYVLMLTSDSPNVNYGYRTETAISMNANSNYMITVDVYNDTNSSIANLSLYNEDGTLFSSIDDINSYQNWTTYHLFVSTNENALKLDLGMNITGEGTVLFDNISVFEVSSNLLQSRIDTQELSNTDYSYVDQTTNTVEEYAVVDNNLKSTSKTVAITNTNFVAGKDDIDYTESKTVTDSNGSNVTAFKIHNKQKTFVEYSTDTIVEVPQNSIYNVTVSVKTKNLSGSANLKLVQTGLETDEKGIDSEVISISSATKNKVTNGYQNYSFYVLGNHEKASKYKLVFSLGSTETEASGEMYVAGVNISKINHSTYSNASSGTNLKKIDLVGDSAYNNSAIYLNNGEFNSIKVEDYNKVYPATPADWTVTKGTNEQVYGVVNTLETEFNKITGLNALFNPYSTEKNNNVLMMHNTQGDVLSYTSSSKSLAANSYHKFEIDVQTQNAPVTVSLITSKDDKEIVLSSIVIETGVWNWKTATFFVKTGYQAVDVSLKVELKSEAYAYAYLDAAKFDYLIAPTETQFNNASNSETINKVDLSDLFATNENKQFANSTLFSGKNVENAVYGILNLDKTNINTQINADYLNEFLKLDGENRKVLGLRANADLNYTVTSNLGYKIESGKKYKLSVSVYTQNLQTEVDGVEVEQLGANIHLTGFENGFTAISSNNQWTTYTFYIEADSTIDASYLEFSIGSEEFPVSGDVFFGNIEFVTDVTDEEFEKVEANDTTKIIKPVKEETEDDKEEDKDSTTSNGLDKQTLLYLIPSILFGLAILITIIGVAARKIKWKKPSFGKKKAKNEYDRTKTVNKQVYARRAAVMRETKLRELTKDLEDLTATRTQAEEEYKSNLSKLREMKIKRASASEISKLEKEMKKHQKTSAQIGVTISRLQSEIDYVKTDAYLKAILRKLAQERNEKDTTIQNNEEK